jgi:hypothetical protein
MVVGRLDTETMDGGIVEEVTLLVVMEGTIDSAEIVSPADVPEEIVVTGWLEMTKGFGWKSVVVAGTTIRFENEVNELDVDNDCSFSRPLGFEVREDSELDDRMDGW